MRKIMDTVTLVRECEMKEDEVALRKDISPLDTARRPRAQEAAWMQMEVIDEAMEALSMPRDDGQHLPSHQHRPSRVVGRARPSNATKTDAGPNPVP